ncbi:uncharacterized protein LOC133299634 [Gastrolobium bilobum]|uniref:uncharacterized protein LOC133299634 n=1 Tax=Gastrolobium bilobum TaxID=150636 RepID=UPI002AB2B79A|nr:uncharacterized protein LOC133299634 [Gastrolobium bilobum]
MKNGERQLLGPELGQVTTEQIEMIRDRLKKAQSRKKSYYDEKHKPLEFSEGDRVFIRLSPTTGVGRALGVRKLSPRFIRPYQIIKKVGPVAYQLALPPNLANLHDVLHVSKLRRYISDDSHIVQLDDVGVKKDLKFVVGPFKVVARDEKRLRNRVIPIVKINWEGLTPEDATWEREDDILRRYPDFYIRYVLCGKTAYLLEKDGSLKHWCSFEDVSLKL